MITGGFTVSKLVEDPQRYMRWREPRVQDEAKRSELRAWHNGERVATNTVEDFVRLSESQLDAAAAVPVIDFPLFDAAFALKVIGAQERTLEKCRKFIKSWESQLLNLDRVVLLCHQRGHYFAIELDFKSNAEFTIAKVYDSDWKGEIGLSNFKDACSTIGFIVGMLCEEKVAKKRIKCVPVRTGQQTGLYCATHTALVVFLLQHSVSTEQICEVTRDMVAKTLEGKVAKTIAFKLGYRD